MMQSALSYGGYDPTFQPVMMGYDQNLIGSMYGVAGYPAYGVAGQLGYASYGTAMVQPVGIQMGGWQTIQQPTVQYIEPQVQMIQAVQAIQPVQVEKQVVQVIEPRVEVRKEVIVQQVVHQQPPIHQRVQAPPVVEKKVLPPKYNVVRREPKVVGQVVRTRHNNGQVSEQYIELAPREQERVEHYTHSEFSTVTLDAPGVQYQQPGGMYQVTSSGAPMQMTTPVNPTSYSSYGYNQVTAPLSPAAKGH